MSGDVAPRGSEIPDTVPEDLVAAYGREARRIVRRRFRPGAAEIGERWLSRTVTALMFAAVVGAGLAFVLFVMAVSSLRLVVVGLTVVAVVLAAAVGHVRKGSERR